MPYNEKAATNLLLWFFTQLLSIVLVQNEQCHIFNAFSTATYKRENNCILCHVKIMCWRHGDCSSMFDQILPGGSKSDISLGAIFRINNLLALQCAARKMCGQEPAKLVCSLLHNYICFLSKVRFTVDYYVHLAVVMEC